MDVLHSIFSEYPSAGAVRCREGNCGGDCVESCVGAGVEVVGDGYFVTSSPGSPTQLHLFGIFRVSKRKFCLIRTEKSLEQNTSVCLWTVSIKCGKTKHAQLVELELSSHITQTRLNMRSPDTGDSNKNSSSS
jgi:hypothetical protein